MQEIQNILAKRLKFFFWIEIILLLGILLFLIYLKGPYWGDKIEQNVVFERYAIITTLICIPLALKLFHSKVKKAEKLSYEQYLGIYKKQYLIRFLILDFACLLNLIGFYYLESQNLILMSIIAVCATFFCYPGKNTIMSPFAEEEDVIDEIGEEQEGSEYESYENTVTTTNKTNKDKE